MANKKVTTEELEQLRANNFRLNSLVQELRLEITYYQGETKRLEWEKNVLKQDVNRMSSLFKGWLAELQQNQNNRNIIDDPEYLKALVKYPAKSISEMMQLSDDLIVISTCQAPFFIEYVNKCWSSYCGWDSHDVLGLTCAFLQGEGTDLNAAASFTKDFREIGYGVVRIHNYKKNGDMFAVTLTMFPIFDSMTATGADGETPILTHFATILTDIKPITPIATSNGNSNNSGAMNSSKSEGSSAREGNTTSETNSNNHTGSYSDNSASSSNMNNFDSSLTNTSSGVESNESVNDRNKGKLTTFDKKRKEGYRTSGRNNGSAYDTEDNHFSKHSTQPTDADMAALQDALTTENQKITTTTTTSTVENQNRSLFHNSKVKSNIPLSKSNTNTTSAIGNLLNTQGANSSNASSNGGNSGNASSTNGSHSYDADASMNSSESIQTSSSPSSEDGSNSMYESDMNRSGGSSGNINRGNSSSSSQALGGLSGSNDTSSVTSSTLSTVSSLLPYNFVTGVNDRRSGCIRFDAQCEMSPESFFKAARTVRLSDLLRLMISCQNALLLCDRFGRILHCNKGFASLFEYVLNDMEGHTLHFLYRQPSDIVLFEQCRMLNLRGESTDVTLQGFRKSGSTVYCRVITVPIRGGFRSPDITHYCSFFYPLVTANEPLKKSDEATVTNFSNSTSINPQCFGSSSNNASEKNKGKSNSNRTGNTAGSASANSAAAANSGYGGITANPSFNSSNNPYSDLHGILQRINSSSPLSMSSAMLTPGQIKTKVNASNSTEGLSTGGSTSGYTADDTSNAPKVHHYLKAARPAGYVPQSGVQTTFTPSSSFSPTSTSQSSSFPELTAASLAHNQSSTNAFPSAPGSVPPPSYYSHHQQYYHHNHHDHNQQPPFNPTAVQPPTPHDLYYLNPQSFTYPQQPVYSYNHQSQAHASATATPYMGPYAPPPTTSALAYARSSNIYNFAGAASLAAGGSNPIGLPNLPFSHERDLGSAMQISNNNSRSASPPNVSTGLISVGGFIGGIVDSEQDHYHHSDHYHHCEDQEGSVMYSDSGNDSGNENFDNDNGNEINEP